MLYNVCERLDPLSHLQLWPSVFRRIFFVLFALFCGYSVSSVFTFAPLRLCVRFFVCVDRNG